MLNTIKSIQKFIDNKLADKLRSDAAELHILNERDMEHRIYHHLANEIDGRKFLIFTNKTFSGLKMKRAGWGILPDLIIRDRKNNNAIRISIKDPRILACFISINSLYNCSPIGLVTLKSNKEIDMIAKATFRKFKPLIISGNKDNGLLEGKELAKSFKISNHTMWHQQRMNSALIILLASKTILFLRIYHCN